MKPKLIEKAFLEKACCVGKWSKMYFGFAYDTDKRVGEGNVKWFFFDPKFSFICENEHYGEKKIYFGNLVACDEFGKLNPNWNKDGKRTCYIKKWSKKKEAWELTGKRENLNTTSWECKEDEICFEIYGSDFKGENLERKDFNFIAAQEEFWHKIDMQEMRNKMWEDTKKRWEARGTLYNPWNCGQDYVTSDMLKAGITLSLRELLDSRKYSTAEMVMCGLDEDVIRQYESERDRMFLEARNYHNTYGG